ncbi:hypothetical protein [Thermopirellula anaerolimosa]
MNDWFRVRSNARELHVEFVASRDRFWPPDVLREPPLPIEGVSGRRVMLSGPGAVWMYAHAAARFRAAGAQSVRVESPHKPGDADGFEGSESRLIPADLENEKGALLLVRLRPAPPLSADAVNRLLEPRLDELLRLRPAELVISGRAGVDVYARAASTAIDAGVRRVSCWSARDGLIVVHDRQGDLLGATITRPDWLARAMPKPVQSWVLGVAGDPNSGKSVFSMVLDVYRDRIGCDGWKLDCDGQSPTPPWYLDPTDRETAGKMREAHKRDWTPAMEAAIARQLCRAREMFSVSIADLPGGNHKVSPPQRLPPGREIIFAQVDALILLDKENSPAEAAWREALRPHGLDQRIAAVLLSHDPAGTPSLTVHEENGLLRGRVTGLDRSRSAEDLLEAFREGLDQLWTAIGEKATHLRLDNSLGAGKITAE